MHRKNGSTAKEATSAQQSKLAAWRYALKHFGTDSTEERRARGRYFALVKRHDLERLQAKRRNRAGSTLGEGLALVVALGSALAVALVAAVVLLGWLTGERAEVAPVVALGAIIFAAGWGVAARATGGR